MKIPSWLFTAIEELLSACERNAGRKVVTKVSLAADVGPLFGIRCGKALQLVTTGGVVELACDLWTLNYRLIAAEGARRYPGLPAGRLALKVGGSRQHMLKAIKEEILDPKGGLIAVGSGRSPRIYPRPI